MICLVPYFGTHYSTGAKARPVPAVKQVKASAAELISVTGMILVRKPGRTEWTEVKKGASLMDGDEIQTDDSGMADIRYSNGTIVSIQAKTIFTVQSVENGQMEISAPLPEGIVATTVEAGNGLNGAAKTGDLQPSIVLQRIIPFGKSLELIGHVEAGSRLVVNGENIEVTGDGSFKHFTNPFSASAGKVYLVMKVTNLAGRTRTLAATYDFSPHHGDN